MKTIDAIGVLAGLQERGDISLPPFALEDGTDAGVEFVVACLKVTGRLESIETQQELVDAIGPAWSGLEEKGTTRDEIVDAMQVVLDELEQFGNTMPGLN